MRIFPTKRGWKRLGIALAILIALALIANGFMAWRTNARLQAILGKIRAAGDPASIPELAPPPIPPEKNAAAILDSLTPRINAFAKDHVQFLDRTDLGKAYEANSEGTPPTADQVAAIRAIVENYPDLAAGITAAAACDEYGSRADFSLPYQEFLNDAIENRAQPVRSLVRFYDWKMEVLIAEGKFQEAAQLGLEMLRITRLRNREPLLISYLMNIAVRGITIHRLHQALNNDEVTPELRTRIDQELALQDVPDGLVHAFRTERSLAGTLTSSIGMDSSWDDVHPAWMKLVGWPVQRLYLGALESYDDIIDMTDQPWWKVRDQFGPKINSQLAGKGVLAELLHPALLAAFEAHARSQIYIRALRISNALAAYRVKNGREPAGLADLDLPREATIDPYSGEPLKLKLTDDGWLIYSVMQNGIDDGGDFTDLKDHGLAPPKRP